MELLEQLRGIAIASQGLQSEVKAHDDLLATKQAIKHLGYVQIDTLSVVERAHHHVLWSRVPSYQPDYLNQLVKQQSIFEYWFHAAAYLPMDDYRFALVKMNSIRNGESPYHQKTNPKLEHEVLSRIKSEGPMRLRTLDNQGGGGGSGSWWNYGPVKRTIEQLFMRGELMVTQRHGMEKEYDLAERCLPSELNTRVPTISEFAEYLFNTTKRAHGVFNWKQLVHLRKGQSLREQMRQLLLDHVQTGDIKVIKQEKGGDLYVESQLLEQTTSPNKLLKILSPFDNLVIHRERLKALFNFDYKIECYVTANKRQYGYFCLPILFGDKLVARLDCKAHRAEKRLEVISLHLENVVFNEQAFFSALLEELEKFAHFNGCVTLSLDAIGEHALKWHA
ncbi:winged helix DNA-binding domain-containing protein [Pseudoalteromonas xiamenensis]|uniref:winged helix-turn-helix domain-containing protein n=1 Tax=Pseudoalteromonas xiamenensis TaxID=882626 RepID=UPI0027E435D2|nr:crosslink repair DNA glycosylase YcaQ family protein [Pseudoalteromonas xiamenensis]WMN59566.1 winged helix DNA-binding domain-containing protein [Pseudoalteromonas xiamenensis]